jgi:hypothetical protein
MCGPFDTLLAGCRNFTLSHTFQILLICSPVIKSEVDNDNHLIEILCSRFSSLLSQLGYGKWKRSNIQKERVFFSVRFIRGIQKTKSEVWRFETRMQH